MAEHWHRYNPELGELYYHICPYRRPSMQHVANTPGLHWNRLSIPNRPKVRYSSHGNRERFLPTDFYDIPGDDLVRLQNEGPKIFREIDSQSFKSFPELLQSWLFFALLSFFLSEEIDPLEFTAEASQYLTTEPLPERLRAWVKRIDSMSDHERESHAKFVDEALDYASEFISKWQSHSSLADSSLWLCVAILGETLQHVRTEILPRTDARRRRHGDKRRWGESKHIANSIRDSGWWCPSTTRSLQQIMTGPSGPYVVSCLPAPPRTHKSCKASACTAYSGTEWKFPIHTPVCIQRTQTEAEYRCRDLEVNKDEIDRITNEGDIPLIFLDRRTLKHEARLEEFVATKRFKISNNPQELEYVAISHVWADGLCNETRNALPFCQLSDLQRMVNRIDGDEAKYPKTFFWLDTMCIPVGPPSVRKAGILSICSVFQRASKVLVLDNDLRACSQTDGLEPLIRINMSNWMSRLWTLQEGSLSKDLHFQFDNDIVITTKEIENRLESAKANLHFSWYEAAAVFNPSMKSLRRPDQHNRVVHVWQAVNRRTTSRKMDETICLATLLDLDVESLIDSPGLADERMRSFLIMLDQHVGIPAGMIFLEGPRLDKAGFRWAPQTWMSGLGQQYPDPLLQENIPPAFLMRHGLQVQYHGIEFTGHKKIEGREFVVQMQHSVQEWYRIEYINHAKTTAPRVSMQREKADRLAIIFCREIAKQGPEISLVVSIINERDGVKWVHGVCHAWSTLLMSRNMVNVQEQVRGTHLGLQTWCVDWEPKSELKNSKSIESRAKMHFSNMTPTHNRERSAPDKPTKSAIPRLAQIRQ